MPSYAITGTSRGLGLGLVKALASIPQNTVFALSRNLSSAKDLKTFADGHKNVHAIEGDLDSIKSLQDAAASVSKITGGTLDYLVCNGALMGHQRNALSFDEYPSEEVIDEDLLAFYKTNVLGTIHTINAFLPLIRAGETKKCFVITSGLGGPKFTLQGGYSSITGYSISKAAVNLAVVKYAVRHKGEGILFSAVSPGLVKTLQGLPQEQIDAFFDHHSSMIKEKFPDFEGAITVEQSVNDLLKLFSNMTMAGTGSLVNRDGTPFA